MLLKAFEVVQAAFKSIFCPFHSHYDMLLKAV
jgi:hypothetical protein